MGELAAGEEMPALNMLRRTALGGLCWSWHMNYGIWSHGWHLQVGGMCSFGYHHCTRREGEFVGCVCLFNYVTRSRFHLGFILWRVLVIQNSPSALATLHLHGGTSSVWQPWLGWSHDQRWNRDFFLC